MTTNYLPEQVVVEILLRLPVKSLIRFRCVSKRWRLLISDPGFTKSQFGLASEHPERFLISSSSGIRSLGCDVPFGDSSALRELVVPFQRNCLRVRIIGSCNGLVCVALHPHKGFYIWNPSTGDHRKLPDPGAPLRGFIYWHGFGYDSSTDDYKLIVASYRLVKSDSGRSSEGEVFSLNKNSWKGILHDLDYSDGAKEPAGILCNGSLHWHLKVSEPARDEIYAFDLAEEKFHEIPMPIQEDERPRRAPFSSLRNLGGCLCLVGYTRTHIDLWRMMEYGIGESWAPMLRVAYSHVEVYRYHLNPLWLSRGGQLVLIYAGKELMISKPEGEIEHVVAFSDSLTCEAAVFVESLISPNHYGGDERQRLLCDEDR
ncbi:hypothetical protein F2P56_023952 [Juglans regia]|uniref:F-box/kelch-repeat protein At3g06240-like n=2 Tax=Juglans regia TaxID=51240 RepID=A0A6P9E6L1_JUGRE|nr:F-box/kelch-repeat protein At3g06240-like [Juglans regia]XP_035551280.1 F-box/kelch-repeat protein At3g06240-like [Juglans regia]XP_035551281.1 F-box/kelch-repeat protein At3g06240-like [Juglans regia]KAF5441922.1 hypothetical protein F2P56_037132 [Juglans regia]KAF5454275.1 hypothetical protein F2P56_023952 [Juglans regia]